jgi:hypothetical protein
VLPGSPAVPTTNDLADFLDHGVAGDELHDF